MNPAVYALNLISLFRETVILVSLISVIIIIGAVIIDVVVIMGKGRIFPFSKSPQSDRVAVA